MELAIPFLDLFREEFFVALGQALEWSDDDAQRILARPRILRKAQRPRQRRVRRGRSGDGRRLPDLSSTASGCCSIRR